MTLNDLLRRIAKRRAELAQHVLEGSVKDWEGYKSKLAAIRTLDEVVEMTRTEEEKEDGSKKEGSP